MKKITFLTGTIAESDGVLPHKLELEVDRPLAFGIIEKLNKFIENIPVDSHKATFLNIIGEAHVEGDSNPTIE